MSDFACRDCGRYGGQHDAGCPTGEEEYEETRRWKAIFDQHDALATPETERQRLRETLPTPTNEDRGDER